MKYLKKSKISTKLTFYFTFIFLCISVLFYFLLPSLLNYPPHTINTKFDKDVSGLYYIYQYIIAITVVIILFTIYFKVSLKKIDKWQKNKTTNIETILDIRKICFRFPYKSYLILEIVPVTIVSLVLGLTGAHSEILIFKIGILVFSFATLLSSFFLIISRNILYPILRESSRYINESDTRYKIALPAKLVFEIFPSILVTALLIALIGYSRLTAEKGNLICTYYKTNLSNILSSNIETDNLMQYLNDNFSNLLLDTEDFIFIENSNGDIITSNNSELDDFFIKYMHELSSENDNRVYETYTVDAQGVINTFTYNGETYTVGIHYRIVSSSLLYYFLLSSALLFLFNLIILFYITKSLNSDINTVVEGLNEIISDENNVQIHRLPITTNDSLGELAMSFNKIQELTKNNIDEIHDNQEMLMERERLASLGQLIGGIAHNLKTPIMSISGASEGLNDLINEYKQSITNPQVTVEDHYAISNDMLEWVTKIKSYTEYMSDVITAVKGQAVTLSENLENSFTVEELVKRVDILMKHELKNAIIYLKVSLLVDEKLTLHGNINSLVQVINNMISNAIQAYNGETEKTIELIVSKENNNVIISIKDYASGISNDIKDKLFKEMITTKGKNGTGLGLYMSYSNIRAYFNGNITINSTLGEGTTFNIILPLL